MAAISELECEETACVEQQERGMDKEKKKTSLREKWKDKEYQRKFMCSLSICGAFVVLGAGVGQVGPTFIDLQIITDTDVEKGSAFLTSGAIGYLLGSILCGVIFDKFNAYLLIFLSVIGFGGAAVVTPFCTNYEAMIFVRFSAAFAGGFLDTGGNALHIELWGTEGEGLMQFLHFCFAFGGVVSPLFSEPFLAPKQSEKEEDISTLESPAMNMTQSDVNATTTQTPFISRETDVKYAFMITGAMAFVFAAPFIIMYIVNFGKEEEEKKNDTHRNQRNLPTAQIIMTMVIICSFYTLYCCIEDSFAAFLMTFLVKEYDSVSKSKGAFITAVYWASFAAARLFMVLLCRIFSSLQLLIICVNMMLVTFISFSVSAYLDNVDALTAFSALAGLSMSAVFPAGFLWTEAELLRVTSRVSAAILVASSLGTMINPLILGYLMERYSNMWFPYLLLTETTAFGIIFVTLLVYSRVYLNKKFGQNNSGARENANSAADDEREGNTELMPQKV